MKGRYMEVLGVVIFILCVVLVYMYVSRERTTFSDTVERLKVITQKYEEQEKILETYRAQVDTLTDSNAELRSLYMRSKEGIDDLKNVCTDTKGLNEKLQAKVKEYAEEVSHVQEHCQRIVRNQRILQKNQLRLEYQRKPQRIELELIEPIVPQKPSKKPKVVPPPVGMSGVAPIFPPKPSEIIADKILSKLAEVSDQVKSF